MSESPAEGEGLELRKKNEERVEEIVEDLASAIEGLGKLKPKIQGAIEVSIGILMALAAITYLAVGISIYLTLMLYWEIFIYIPAGGLTIAADRKPTRAKLCAALWMNVLVALSAIAGSLLHYFTLTLMSSGGHANSPHEELLINTEWFMLAASILLFLVSILVVSATASALCCSRKGKAACGWCWQEDDATLDSARCYELRADVGDPLPLEGLVLMVWSLYKGAGGSRWCQSLATPAAAIGEGGEVTADADLMSSEPLFFQRRLAGRQMFFSFSGLLISLKCK
ncbi:unnamed protein product, partial [Gadus morhua 'NCC']